MIWAYTEFAWQHDQITVTPMIWSGQEKPLLWASSATPQRALTIQIHGQDRNSYTWAEIPTQQQSSLPRHANYQASKVLCTDSNSTSPFLRMHKAHPIQRLSTSSILRYRKEINASAPSWLANENSNYQCWAETNQLASTLGCDTPPPPRRITVAIL